MIVLIEILLWNHHADFYSGCPGLCSSPGREVTLSPYPNQNNLSFAFLLAAILLPRVRFNLHTALICISPMAKDAEYILKYSLAMWIYSFGKCLLVPLGVLCWTGSSLSACFIRFAPYQVGIWGFLLISLAYFLIRYLEVFFVFCFQIVNILNSLQMWTSINRQMRNWKRFSPIS